MGVFDSAGPGRPRRAGHFARSVRLAAAALLAAAVGCFQPDFLAYAACASSESCKEAGLHACVVIPDRLDLPGFCADTCGADDDCPAGQDGNATPRCLPVGGASVCALDCLGERTCPMGYVCRDVRDADAAPRGLCFPLEDAP